MNTDIIPPRRNFRPYRFAAERRRPDLASRMEHFWQMDEYWVSADGTAIWFDELRLGHLRSLLSWLGLNADALFARELRREDITGAPGQRRLPSGNLAPELWQGDGWEWLRMTPLYRALSGELSRRESRTRRG